MGEVSPNRIRGGVGKKSRDTTLGGGEVEKEDLTGMAAANGRSKNREKFTQISASKKWKKEKRGLHRKRNVSRWR